MGLTVGGVDGGRSSPRRMKRKEKAASKGLAPSVYSCWRSLCLRPFANAASPLLRCMLSLWLLLLLLVGVWGGGAPAAAQQEAAGGGSPEGLSIGPSQVLLPWVPPSVSSHFPAVRAQLQLQQEDAHPSLQGKEVAVCFYWASQNRHVVSLLHPDCAAEQAAAACSVEAESEGGPQGAAGGPSRGPPCFSRVLVEATPQAVGRRASSWVFASAERGLNTTRNTAGDPWGSPGAPEGAAAATAAGAGAGGGRRAFRAQVLVAPIVRLSFSTRDKRLAIGQLADVSLLGFDEEGNVFSSLEGLPFEWEIIGEENILSIESVAADAVAGTPARRLVEERGSTYNYYQQQQQQQQEEEARGVGVRSDAIVLRGLRTGVVTVRARLALEEYKEVKAAEVSFLVVELFTLSPAALLVPPGAVFNIKLLRLWVRYYTFIFIQMHTYIFIYF